MQPLQSPVDQNGFNQQQIQFYMNQALSQAKKAYEVGQVPVGCVFVSRVQNETNDKDKYSCKIMARSHNLTNVYKNATRHCEINCINYMLSINEQKSQQRKNINNSSLLIQKVQTTLISPQKQFPDQLCNLYLFVTVQPCIMCTYALNLFCIKFVYFGQFNDKFGGCGSVMSRNNFKFRGGVKPDESIKLIKEFYQRGNQRIDEEKRNRRKKKVKGNEEGGKEKIKEKEKEQIQENQ